METIADYQLSVASRFWGVSPWELEEREDKRFWIVRAVMFEQAEHLAQEIQVEAAKLRQKK